MRKWQEMMHNKKKGTEDRNVSVMAGPVTIYSGKWQDVPIGEDLMLEKSMEYFQDPEPCYIHRAGVRQRLLGETGSELTSPDPALKQQGIDMIRRFLDCDEVTEVIFGESG